MRWHQFAALAAMLAVLLSPLLQLLFSSSAGRYLGRISFVMYLLQLPVICSFTAWVIVRMEGYGRLQVAAVAGVSTVVLLCLISNLTVRLIDESAVRLSRLAGGWFDGLFPDKPAAQGVGQAAVELTGAGGVSRNNPASADRKWD
jgi:peptidoglycan/LPS O-acetylase OafA/YrhL